MVASSACYFLPQLTVQMLVVRRIGATAGSLDGWGRRKLKVLPVARVLSNAGETGVRPDGLLDAYYCHDPQGLMVMLLLLVSGLSVSPPSCVLALGFCPYGSA